VISRRRPLATLASVAALVALASCGGGDEEPTGDTADAASLVDAEVEILAIDNAFDPEAATIEAGTTVTFTNVGRNDHNVIPEEDEAEWTVSTEDFGPGDSASHRFTEPGEYRYYCSIHGTIDVGMPGTITVTNPGG